MVRLGKWFRSGHFIPTEPSGTVRDRWSTSFRWYEKSRLGESENEKYAADSSGGVYRIAVKTRNVFAWEVAADGRYNDVILDAKVRIAETNGRSACGFLIRYADERNFYYFLVSSDGRFRFDVVFNGTQIPLIDWTECPLIRPDENNLRMLAYGTHFVFFAEDEWVAESWDDTIRAGQIGFGAQNFEEEEKAVFDILSLQVESRPLEVERWYQRWERVIPIRSDLRVNFAQSLMSVGKFSEAAEQLGKLNQTGGDGIERLMLARCMSALGKYQDALESIESYLGKNPSSPEAKLEKSKLLYALNRFIDCRDYLKSEIATLDTVPESWNLLGNTEYTLGNWYEAIAAYERARELRPDFPLFESNTARALEQAGRAGDAVRSYLAAAVQHFKHGEYDELEGVLARILDIDPMNPHGRELRGKVRYHQGAYSEALTLFQDLIDSGYEDSSIRYLCGLIRIHEDDRVGALSFLESAVRGEPDYYLYWFRLAESKFLLGKEYSTELRTAESLAPEDPWVNNLVGLRDLRNGDLSAAEQRFRQALEVSPQERDIILNLSDVLLRSGRNTETLEILGEQLESQPDARIWNQRGNVLAALGKKEEALEAYEEALAIEPTNVDVLENCIGACIELDRITRADELVGRLSRLTHRASTYNLIGNLAALKGDRQTAERAYLDGLAEDPGSRDIQTNLTMIYVREDKYVKAKEAVDRLLESDRADDRALKLRDTMREKFERCIACECDTIQWWVPKNLSPQPRLVVRGELPPNAPAGKCTQCGRIYCIGCGSSSMRNKRFVCPHDGEFLKLSDDELRYIVKEFL